MLTSLLRKSRQVASDAVLRQWLLGRALGRWPGEPAFEPHRPPYLQDQLPYAGEASGTRFVRRSPAAPGTPVTLQLAGQDLTLEPGELTGLFTRPFLDLETRLSLHRFAWLAADDTMDPHWVDAIWEAWTRDFASPDQSWVWHPYTAGERAVNLLRFARSRGLSGDAPAFCRVLSVHAGDIARKLEYFGDHHTSNHLANNGRCLYLIGLWLGLEKARDMGAKLLLAEAERIFLPSGMLREGSSHYHLLLAGHYREVAEAARAANRTEAAALQQVAERALGPVKSLVLPGGLPLIGDISPDCTPRYLLAHLPSGGDEAAPPLQADGWLRHDAGPWSGLWYASPDGWSPMPGHGHQDLGSFELHYDDEPLFVDLGRGAYGDEGEAALYRSARMHNGLTLNDQDPYPANRPYYNADFRSRTGGPRPQLACNPESVTLTYHNRATCRHQRHWQFTGDGLVISDRLEGTGQYRITRRLNTPLTPRPSADGVHLSGAHAYRLTCPGFDIKILPVTRWYAYGRGQPAHQIEISTQAALPFDTNIRVEVLGHDR